MELLILAAGMGSRFGGLKQIEPINENNEFIIDYSIFDAIKCGFTKVIFIIKEENYELFKNTVGNRIADKIKVEYVFQRLDYLPKGFSVPKDRQKPWGTAHAVLCAEKAITTDFAIINADDFYGLDAFKIASEHIKNRDKTKCLFSCFFKPKQFALITYEVEKTLSENGSTKRGVCKVEKGYLKTIYESKVEKVENKILITPLETNETFEIDKNTPVSMNMWCLNPTIFKFLKRQFKTFLKENLTKNYLDCEFLIPSSIEAMLKKKIAKIKCYQTNSKWLGITYKEDKETIIDAIKQLSINGDYPNKLWN